MVYYLDKQQKYYIEVVVTDFIYKIIFLDFFHKCKIFEKETYLLKSTTAGMRSVWWNLNYMYYIFGVIFFFKTFITSLQIRVIFIIGIIKGYINSLIKYEEQCRISTKSIKSEVYFTNIHNCI